MRVKTYSRVLRSLSVVVLFFFVWTFCSVWEAVAFAAISGKADAGGRKADAGQSGRAGTQTPEERFNKALEDIREKVAKAGEKAAKGEDDASERAAIKARKAEVDALSDELRSGFSETERKLKAAGLPKEILTRHADFVAHFESNVKELRENIDGIETAKTKSDRKAKIEKARLHLDKSIKRPSHTPLDPNRLPHRSIRAKEKAPRLTPEEFKRDFPQKPSGNSRNVADFRLLPDLRSYRERLKPILLASNEPSSDIPFSLGLDSSNSQASAADSLPVLLAQQTTELPTPEDSAEAPPAIQFTPDIRDLAVTQLGCKPAKIFEWTYNNIDFVPSYSSIQGADMCLQTRQCNAFDANALLISMLRSCSFPSRMVYGTIELPIDKVMNWVGGFTDPMAAATFMASGGIPVKPIATGGKVTKIVMEHAWTETYIPYGNYRGSMGDNSLPIWIPMDASYKQYTYTNGFDITGAVPFNQDEYMSQVQSQNAVHYYQGKIQEYLDANMPETSVVDVKGYREIKQEKFPFLPSTHYYKPLVLAGKFASIPASMQATVTVTLTNPADGESAATTFSLPEIAGKRVTLSYVPATADDEALIAKYGGFLYDVPAYMLHLKPVLRIEGDIKLTGEVTTLGSEQAMTLQFYQPNGSGETISKKVIAGAYYAIGMDLQGINENVLGKRNNRLSTNVLSETAGTLGADDLIGEHLFILATTYHFANDKIYRAGAKLFNTAITRTLSEGITSFTLAVSHLFSMPLSAMPSGINMDVAMDRVIAVAKDGNADQEKAYMEVAGLVSSYHEHDIFERIEGFASVSAVRALQVARENGITIQRIDSVNISQMLPTLQISPDIKSDIQNAVNAGKEVTISQTNVTINDWNGVGYIIKDLVTGAGSYMISGGLAGSENTSVQDGMQCVDIFNDSGGWLKDRIDPLTRRNIVTAANLQIGEEIMVDAATIQAAGASYEDISACTGLVIQSYAAAGIDLVKKATDAGFGNPYNVSVLYLFANSKPEFIVGEEGPILGDIIFFNNTNPSRSPELSRTGDNNVTHAGIVSGVLDGEVYSMIHASSTRGVVFDVFSSGLMQNNYWNVKLIGYGRPR